MLQVGHIQKPIKLNNFGMGMDEKVENGKAEFFYGP